MSHKMTMKHEDHLDELINQFVDLVSEKYVKGVEQHGGKLWLKKGLIDMAIDEAIDQVVYLLTLKQQIKSGRLGILDE